MTTNKSNAVRKDDTAAPANDTKGAASSLKAAVVLIGKAVNAIKITVQSMQQQEPILAEAAMATLVHAEKYGDVTLADRLVKEVRDIGHSYSNQMALELVAWFRLRSPIRWDAKENVRQAKPGESGYKDYDVVGAKTEAFYQTTAAVESRKAAELTRKRVAGDPLTLDNMVARARGLRKTYEAALTKKDDDGHVKGIAKGDKSKMVQFLAKIDEVLAEFAPEAEDKKAA